MIEKNKYPFVLPDLTYDYDALEPHIDKETMHLHHDKHLNAYVNNLNSTLEKHPEFHHLTLEEMLREVSNLPEEVFNSVKNNGGGTYTHSLYFSSLGTKHNQDIPEIITKSFGGTDEFKKKMKLEAMKIFGSGFAWLVQSEDKELKIISLPNQETPFSRQLTPILNLDVWEHAYYLKYKNLRGDYIDNWFKVVDWQKVAKRIKQ